MQSLQAEAGLPARPLSDAIPDLLTPPGSPQLQPGSPQLRPASKSASPVSRRQGPVNLLADAAAEELSEAALMPCLDAKQSLEAARSALAAADVADRLSLDWQAQNAVHLLCKCPDLYSLCTNRWGRRISFSHQFRQSVLPTHLGLACNTSAGWSSIAHTRFCIVNPVLADRGCNKSAGHYGSEEAGEVSQQRSAEFATRSLQAAQTSCACAPVKHQQNEHDPDTGTIIKYQQSHPKT